MTTGVPAQINFSQEEESVQALWKELDAFKTSLSQSKGKPKFTFYDGPPFATGLPHYGHILAGTIKDIITRWQHQHGFHVERRFGWDTHGLPVEYEIDKTLNIKGPEDVAKMGIAAYNAECRKIVMRYSKEWETIMGRMGRWIDFQNDYKTLYPWYMESLWWVFRQLWDKGLIYQGFRVMPYSTGCATPLSNFEATQNYKDVQDPAVTVSFPLDGEKDVHMVAWTTTPWTLPSNLALCVHPELTYVKVKEVSSGRHYILMEARLGSVFKQESDYEVLDKFPGAKLKGKSYKPLFDYFAHMKEQGAFKVLTDGYVTEDSGTGVVHQAPFFGEDDNRVCKAHGVITPDGEVVCPLDGVGRFVDPVTDFKGQYVKDADKNIIKKLKEDGRLFSQAQLTHSYPFCWRSETPLLYRAVPSWFCRVEQMRQTLLEKNDETYWVPESIREGRFANWLRDARDWNLSRNRYWGTPIPVWMSEDGEESVCIGSIEELETLSGVKVNDLHRETVDEITIPSKRPGCPPLKRIPEVFDCWFESGSMPYAQSHYPFENKKEFEDNFPADFIAEGTDQTRGWFYTLLVLSTALFNKPPFKNLIVNGLVLASDGQKMSKKKKNYPDPMIVVNKYGADAVRLYVINSPVVKAESLRFKEEGVKDVLKDVFLPWFNAYRFLMQNIDTYNADVVSEADKFMWSEDSIKPGQGGNVMDRWIISFTQSLLKFVHKEMAAYRLYTVLPRLMKFIDNLTNWYVRTNRKRLKGEGVTRNDTKAALDTLFMVVYTLVRVMAPFTPFLTEHMYQRLRMLVSGQQGKDKASVHYLMIPQARDDLIDVDIERSVARMQAVIELGRVVRDRKTMPVKYPLPEIVVINKDQQVLDDVSSLRDYILDELNVKKLTLSTKKQDYGVMLRAEPDHKTLGFRLKGAFKDVTKEIKGLTDDHLTEFVKSGKMTLLGHDIGPEDVRIMYTFDATKVKEDMTRFEAHSSEDILILLDTTPDQSMLDEGVAREVVNRIQKLRKKAGLAPTDEVTVHCHVQPAGHDLARVISEHREYIETTTKNPLVDGSTDAPVIARESYDLKGAKMVLAVVKGIAAKPAETYGQPKAKFVNVVHGNQVGVVLLENPVGSNTITTPTQLLQEVEGLFGQGVKRLFKDKEGQIEVREVSAATSGQTLYTSSGSPVSVAGSGCCCPWVDIESGQKTVATLLLENPKGSPITQYSGQALQGVFRTKAPPAVVNAKKEPVELTKVKAKDCSGQTLTVK